ncbi:hypothetical protein [uncultured Bacteroides sp.]|uniref:hypothetical protein n=1 Tax=uncultured Bacteroides sp. TaxID=162156 RepID=UPI0025888C88|nr:hypothetical protein [uncultured Bacteroides sp.]
MTHLVFLRPAAGNRRARSWQPDGPQLATGQPPNGKRGFASFRVTFYITQKRKKNRPHPIFLMSYAICDTVKRFAFLLKIFSDVHFLLCFLVKPNSLRKFAR